MDSADAEDSDLERWFASILDAERSLLQERLERAILAQLDVHRNTVFSAVKDRLRVPTAPALKKAAVPFQAVEIVAERCAGYLDRDARSQEREEQVHTFPEHLHTHEPIELPDELHKSLAQIRALASQTRKTPIQNQNDSSERQYRSPQMRALAGQSSATARLSTHWLPRFVCSGHFEVCSAFLILACTIAMVAEIQYNGLSLGHSLNVTHFDEPARQIWPHAPPVFRCLTTIFNMLFLLEVLLRIGVHRLHCIRDAWIYFDVFLVTMGWLDEFKMLDFALNPIILRVVRLSRLLRLLKVLKAVQSLETLFLLVRSLQASLGALVWSFALLWSAQVVTGILMCQILQEFMSNPDNDADARKAVFYYFGTFTHATVTMFEITLANWVTSCRVLYTEVSTWFAVFYILYRGCFMFAVIRVITAVFLAETARCAASDDDIAMRLKHRQKEAYCKKMATIFTELDETQQGYISAKEFAPLMTDGLLKTWLTTLEIDTSELDQLFKMLEDGNDRIDLHAFTEGMTRIRGNAKSIDILKLQVATKQLQKKVDSLIEPLVRTTSAFAPASPVSWMRNSSPEAADIGGKTAQDGSI